MRQTHRALLAIALLGTTAACTMAKISGRGSQPLILNNPTQRVTVVEHFTESKRVMFDYTGAFDVSEVIGNRLQSQSADAVTNLTMTIKTDVGDFLINLVTLGFAASKTFVVEGDLVRMTATDAALLDGAEVLASADADGRLRANVADFTNAQAAPVIVRTPAGLKLVRITK